MLSCKGYYSICPIFNENYALSLIILWGKLNELFRWHLIVSCLPETWLNFLPPFSADQILSLLLTFSDLILIVVPVSLMRKNTKRLFLVCLLACFLSLPLCSRQSWQGQINAPLIWRSVTEDSLMHRLVCPPQWPRDAIFFILEKCTDILSTCSFRSLLRSEC